MPESTPEPLCLACRCGAVEIEVSGEPLAQMYCHCDDCQAVHGAPYVPESVYRAESVRVVRGEPGTWKLKRNPRFTCRDCGTRLFIDVLGIGLRGVNGYMLPPGKFIPTFHMNCRFAVNPIRDGLPHYLGRAPAFGGPNETTDW
jgi:hypothetical protein